MSLKVFTPDYLDGLTAAASLSPRRRQHRNIHEEYSDGCQRLFNAIEPDSYIRPHRHGVVPRAETMIAVRGLMVLLTFDDDGAVVDMVRFGVDAGGRDVAVGVEIPAGCWHTVVSLVSGSVLLELKAGPFDPEQPKEFAAWAPEDGAEEAAGYLRGLVELAGRE
jgi:cupin fold WbuC family metalloprotein